MTVDHLLDHMSSAELTRWIAYDELRAEEQEKQKRMSKKGMMPRGFGRRRRR